MTPRSPLALCARCGRFGKPYQLNDLVQFDKNEPVVVFCYNCVRLLKYEDGGTWEWFRRYRDRLSQGK